MNEVTRTEARAFIEESRADGVGKDRVMTDTILYLRRLATTTNNPAILDISEDDQQQIEIMINEVYQNEITR